MSRDELAKLNARRVAAASRSRERARSECVNTYVYNRARASRRVELAHARRDRADGAAAMATPSISTTGSTKLSAREEGLIAARLVDRERALLDLERRLHKRTTARVMPCRMSSQVSGDDLAVGGDARWPTLLSVTLPRRRPSNCRRRRRLGRHLRHARAEQLDRLDVAPRPPQSSSVMTRSGLKLSSSDFACVAWRPSAVCQPLGKRAVAELPRVTGDRSYRRRAR